MRSLGKPASAADIFCEKSSAIRAAASGLRAGPTVIGVAKRKGSVLRNQPNKSVTVTVLGN